MVILILFSIQSLNLTFAQEESTNDIEIKIVLLGHVYSDRDALVKSVNQINELNPNLVFFLGDNIYFKPHIPNYTPAKQEDINSWDDFFSIINKLEAPVYIVPGNHDIEDSSGEEYYKEQLNYFKENIGPLNQIITIGNNDFLLLNSVHGTKPNYDVSKEEIDFVKNALNNDNRKFIFIHHDLFPSNGIRGRGSPDNNWNSVIVPMIKDEVSAVFIGDGAVKIPYFHFNEENIDYYGVSFSNDYRMLPQHFLIVTLTDDNFSVEPVIIRRDLTQTLSGLSYQKSFLTRLKDYSFNNFRMLAGIIFLLLIFLVIAVLYFAFKSKKLSNIVPPHRK